MPKILVRSAQYEKSAQYAVLSANKKVPGTQCEKKSDQWEKKVPSAQYEERKAFRIDLSWVLRTEY